MKLSITALTILLRLVTSSLHQKECEIGNKESIDGNDKNAVHNIVLPESSPFTWKKEELVSFVKELRQMELADGFFSDSFSLEIDIMGDEYKDVRDDAYFEILCQKLFTFVLEAKNHGLELGSAITIILGTFYSDFEKELLPIVMKSDNVEVKAAILCRWGANKSNWNTYYPLIEKDEPVKRRLLELLGSHCFYSSFNRKYIVPNWAKSLLSDFVNEELNDCEIEFFQLYAQYALRYYKWSANNVIKNFYQVSDYEKYLRKMASKHVSIASSAEIDFELAHFLGDFGVLESARKVLLKSKYKNLPDGEMRMLKFISRYEHDSPFREMFFRHHFKVNDLSELNFSDLDFVNKLFKSGNFMRSVFFQTNLIWWSL